MKREKSLALSLFIAGALTSVSFSLATGCAQTSGPAASNAQSVQQGFSSLSPGQVGTVMQSIQGNYGGTYNTYSQDPRSLQFTNLMGTSNYSVQLSFQNAGQNNGQNSGNATYAYLNLGFPSSSMSEEASAYMRTTSSGTQYIFVTATPAQSSDVSSFSSFLVELVIGTRDGYHFDQSQSGIYFIDCGSTQAEGCSAPLKDARFNDLNRLP